MRPATDTIHAPPFPRDLPWIGTAALRVDKQLGRPLVVVFWDARRGTSLRAMGDLQGWHERYASRGARVIGVHVDGDDAGLTEADARAAAGRLGLTMPIVVDADLRIAEAYGVQGVPSRYIFDQGLRLVDAHFGLGGVADGEAVLRALVEHGERELAARGERASAASPATEPEVDEGCDQGAAVPPAKQPRLIVRPPEDGALPAPVADAAPFVAPEPAETLPGSFDGPYVAGGVWLVARGRGTVEVAGLADPVQVDGAGAYLAADHGLHTRGDLALVAGPGVEIDEVQLEPGVLPD